MRYVFKIWFVAIAFMILGISLLGFYRDNLRTEGKDQPIPGTGAILIIISIGMFIYVGKRRKIEWKSQIEEEGRLEAHKQKRYKRNEEE